MIGARNWINPWLKRLIVGCIIAGLCTACAPLMNLVGTYPSEMAAPVVEGGDPARGRVLIHTYGCGSCHTIPGIASANSTIGPPLNNWAERHYIAGAVPNEPEQLIQWIREPQSIEPGTLMPDLNVSEQDARDIAALLYTLRR